MIYFLRAGADGPVKIGRTKDQRTLKQRVATLQIGQAHRLVILRTIEGDRAEEAWLHGLFAGVRMAGEWFQYSEEMRAVVPPVDVLPPIVSGALQLRLTDQDVADLDGYCSNIRRRTGQHVTRSGVIRQAIREFVERTGFDPPKPTDKAA